MICESSGSSGISVFPKLAIKKKVIHKSLIVCDSLDNRANPRHKKSLKTLYKSSDPQSTIVQSKDLPNFPFYMSKLLARTPSPLKSTHCTFNKAKQSLFMPFKFSSPAEVALENSKKTNMLVTKVLCSTLKIEKINKRVESPIDKVKFNQFNIRLTKLIKRLNN